MKYFHKFNASSDYENYVSSTAYTEPFVATINKNNWYISCGITYYNVGEDENREQEMINTPFTIECMRFGGNFTIRTSNGALARTVEYSKNGGSWTTLNITTATTTIALSIGDTLRFRGNNSYYATSDSIYTSFGDNDSGTTCQFGLYGNIMSLFDSKNFATLKEFTQSYAVGSMFKRGYGCKAASSLVLPATALTQNVYFGLFQGCQFKRGPRVLPAPHIGDASYNCMFQSMWTLEEMPIIMATGVNGWGCNQMFAGCTALKETTPLIFTNVVANGCNGMFKNCTSLNKVTCLIENPNTSDNTKDWLTNVSATGTFYKSSSVAESSFPRNGNGIPTGWTIANA